MVHSYTVFQEYILCSAVQCGTSPALPKNVDPKQYSLNAIHYCESVYVTIAFCLKRMMEVLKCFYGSGKLRLNMQVEQVLCRE